MLVIERDTCLQKAKQLDELILERSKKLSWNPEKITWTPAQGAKGPYQRSDDVNNPDFKTLLKNLAANQGKLTRNGYYYWTFTNGATIGRKKQKTQAQNQP